MTSTPVTADSPQHGGARSDPFPAYCDEYGYYADAAREKRLNLLLHLAPYSDLLLVTGEEGSGKTTFIRRFLAAAGDGWRILTLQGNVALGDAGLLAALDRELSVRVDEDADRATRLAGLRRSLHMLRRGGLVPILLVDDAHLLPQSAFGLLAELAEPREDEGKERPLGIILAGEDEPLNTRLSAPGGEALRARVSHTFDLPPFSEADTASYIRHRLAAAGQSGAAFTPAVYRFIHTASRGVPARINECARVVLDKQARQQAQPVVAVASTGVGVGALLRYGGAALVLALLAVALVYRAELAALLPGERGPDVMSRSIPGSMPHSMQDTIVDRDGADDGEAGVLAAPLLPASGAEPVADGILPAAIPYIMDAAAVDGEVVETVPERAAEPASEPAPEPESGPDSALAAADEPARKAAADSAPKTAAQADAPAAAPPLPAVTADEERAPSALRRESWLMAQSPQAYTVQLLASDEARILAFIAEHGLQGDAAVFQARAGERPLYALSYGVYPNRAAAEQALGGETLRGIRGITPWVRSLKDIQAAIAALGVAAGGG